MVSKENITDEPEDDAESGEQRKRGRSFLVRSAYALGRTTRFVTRGPRWLLVRTGRAIVAAPRKTGESASGAGPASDEMAPVAAASETSGASGGIVLDLPGEEDDPGE